jgi:23S rRNA (cytosine1962-C5)-methyltransferase
VLGAALEVARENLAANPFDASKVEFVAGRRVRALRSCATGGAVRPGVLDPPKFAPTAAQAKNAARAYKDINLLAFKLLRPAGCSPLLLLGRRVRELFQSIVAGAALDAGPTPRSSSASAPPPTIPSRSQFPEGEYLKGVLREVLQSLNQGQTTISWSTRPGHRR